MPLKALISALVFLVLSGCSYIIADTETLLAPPSLNQRQTEIYNALSATLDIDSIVYKYPQGGQYRSPFVFFDMDADGLDEAFVFYSPISDMATTHVKILSNRGGSWAPFFDFPTKSDSVSFVRFAPLISVDRYCLIIGWQTTDSDSQHIPEKTLGIYSLDGEKFSAEVTLSEYYGYSLHDFDGDYLDEIVTVERKDSSGDMQVSLLRAVYSHLEITDTVPLSGESYSFLKMTSGSLESYTAGAVYIDVELYDGQTATEILEVDGEGMRFIAGGDYSPNEKEPLSQQNFRATKRNIPILCSDFDGDGRIELPIPDSSDDQYNLNPNQPTLTKLYTTDGDTFSLKEWAAINFTEGYLIFIPDAWLGWVSVSEDNEIGEWRFFLRDPVTNDTTIELLRIRVTHDNLTPPPNNFIDLGNSGTRRFFGYIPLTTADVPSIGERQLKELFRTLEA